MKVSRVLTGAQFAPLGLIHVTGLPTVSGFFGEKREYVIQAQSNWLGKWGINNGLFVAITEDGEVWLGDHKVAKWSPHVSMMGTVEEVVDQLLQKGGPTEFERILREVCLNGKGAGVPCSNGEYINGSLLLMRLADPATDCYGFYPSEPRIGG